MEYASREGARVASALANGGGTLGCGAGQSPNAANVDPSIIAAVERVMEASGSPLKPSQVLEIRIFKANASGGGNAGPGQRLALQPGCRANHRWPAARLHAAQSEGWRACSRLNTQPADSVGVSVGYRYDFQTPFLALSGMAQLTMWDRTVMALNPTGT